jgi:integrase
MPRKRRRFGSVRKLPSGQWQARYQDLSGRPHTAPRTFPTEAQADQYLAAVETDLARGNWMDPRAGAMTFRELAQRWASGVTGLRTNTITSYSYLADRLLIPALGDMPIGTLDVAAVREWRRWALGQVGSNTVAKSYRLLRMILAQAVEDGLIPTNPCRIKGAATEKETELRALTVEEVHAIAANCDDRYRALIYLGAFGGLRFAEQVGLRRRDVNLLKQEITVSRQVAEPNGRHEVGPPKTAAGLRTFPLPAPLVPILEHHLANWGGAGPDGLVFPAPDGGFLRRSNFRRRVWLPACDKAGIQDVTVHQMRHSTGTWLAASGGNTREIMSRMGHASPRAALRYQHVMEGRDRLLADKLGALMTPPIEPEADASEGTSGTPMA